MALVTRRVFLAGLSPLAAATQRLDGKRTQVEATAAVFPDPLTERLKWRLTDPKILHHLPHYHHRFIAKNNSFMLVASERTGLRQIYRMNLPKGDMVQLTDGSGRSLLLTNLRPQREELLPPSGKRTQESFNQERPREAHLPHPGRLAHDRPPQRCRQRALCRCG